MLVLQIVLLCSSCKNADISECPKKFIIIWSFWPVPSDSVMILCLNNLWPQIQLLCSFTVFHCLISHLPASLPTFLILSPTITLFASTLPCSLLMMALMDSTVSPSADPTDVHRADAAGRHHGTQVPVKLACHPRGRQHTVRPNQRSGHHSHRQPPLRCQQVARPHWWARTIRQQGVWWWIRSE